MEPENRRLAEIPGDGRIGSTYWAGVITYRGSVIRLISVRRSRPEEMVFYES